MDIPDLPPFLAGLVIGSELFPSLNLSYWEPSYPSNLSINLIARRREQYQVNIGSRYLLTLLSWSCFLALLYEYNPILTLLAGGSLIISFSSRHSLKTMKTYQSLSYFHFIAFFIITNIIYSKNNNKLVLLGPSLLLFGGYLIGQSRNKKEQYQTDLIGRLFFAIGFTIFFISLVSLKS